MALIDLYKVTKTLADLLTQNITKHIDPSLETLLNVVAMPPEKVENPSNTLSLYLYHVAEDPYYKNVLGPGSDMPNVAKAPMALSLFYILTAPHETDSTFDAQTQQKLMGYALKTFHDFPVITDRTRIGGTLILDPDLRGKDNTLQVILRPVSPEDAIAFWSTEDTRTARLSAYYEVRVVMLEPEEPKTMPGIVLNLGTFLMQMGAPHLSASQSLVRFKIPEQNGGAVHQVEATPARVTLDNATTAPEAPNPLLLLGANLTTGRSRSLVLKNSIWAKWPPPDGPIEQAIVDLDQNPGWRVACQTERVTVALAPTLRHVRPDATMVDLPVLPGFYSAMVRAVVDEKVISNVLQQISVSSNEVGFAVAPRITGHDVPDANGTLRIALGPEFDPLDPNLPEEAIQVIVDGEVYTRVSADPPVNPGAFFVTNRPANAIRLKPHFAVTVTQPEAHPLRLIVNGAEAAPFWIELNP
jgi:hypothetical protein